MQSFVPLLENANLGHLKRVLFARGQQLNNLGRFTKATLRLTDSATWCRERLLRYQEKARFRFVPVVESVNLGQLSKIRHRGVEKSYFVSAKNGFWVRFPVVLARALKVGTT